ncbi:SWI/SNF-related matrix-associated actin-dependent regulator of chromatin subfamily A-like protein 1 [Orchesella cincta]|uniref:SWI/SNF-related matrix-associated actin-dependent regulator of chromatin subfamily A-like protein 1 n=1 Tax=Orchesella cincta TaxID=48709 RepID=A0A1D2N4P3_ORCCI|nr:SWI/SNF-related matrix-associated actin-dependent regulator of chromatin subfamily A-like protein 1 [Orchesella cincta]
MSVQLVKPLTSNSWSSSSSSNNTEVRQPFAQPAITSRTLAGSCVLVSRERFMVEIGYYRQLLDIFRSIDGHQYGSLLAHSQTRKWTFPLSEHTKLINAVAPLRPAVSIGPLPNFVQRVFQNVQPGVPRKIPTTDLDGVDKTLLAALMPFQLEGVMFGVSRKGRCLIGDDMGLGKSIQALGIANYYRTDWPLLIVCPSSVRYAWRDYIWKWLPNVVPSGSISIIESSKDQFDCAEILITSYDMLQKRSVEFSHCRVVIMDESHHLKNHKTARTKAAIPLMQTARRLILLSGTPALSRPIELYSQISAIDKSIFPFLNDFGVRYCDGKKNAWGWDFSGSSNMGELQLILEETVMIRRLKSEVLQQLPSKLRKVMLLDPSLVRTKNNKSLKAREAAFSSKGLKNSERRGKLLEYYAETASAKLDAVNAYIKDLINDDKKFICFAHHKSMMDGICAMLEEIKTRYIRIDGSTTAQDRQHAVDLFQHREDVPVAVLSITAANSGITLTAAKLVIFAELYWNPGILTQAEDRAHRIGQMDSVLVEYLLAGGTADDYLWKMVQDKLNVLNRAGLSKDNFSEVDATALVQRGANSDKQTKMEDFFSSQEKMEVEEYKECKDLENDQVLLDQLLDESFN